MDIVENKVDLFEIAMNKVIVPIMSERIIDRAILAFGEVYVSNDMPSVNICTNTRILRVADIPNNVHRRQIFRLKVRMHQ